MTRTEHQVTTMCPGCSRPLDASSGVGHDFVPSEGDYTICLYCLEVMRYGAGLALSSAEAIPDEVMESVAKVRVLQEALRRINDET